jgi:prepilin peptidase CpaA
LSLVCGVMLVSFAIGALAFSAGWIGGGDVKLVAAACGLAGFPGCLTLVLCIAIAGGVLALLQAARQHRLLAILRSASVLAMTGSLPQTRTLLPYGVAIAGGSTAYAFSTLHSVMRLPQ